MELVGVIHGAVVVDMAEVDHGGQLVLVVASLRVVHLLASLAKFLGVVSVLDAHYLGAG